VKGGGLASLGVKGGGLASQRGPEREEYASQRGPEGKNMPPWVGIYRVICFPGWVYPCIYASQHPFVGVPSPASPVHTVLRVGHGPAVYTVWLSECALLASPPQVLGLPFFPENNRE